MGRDGGRSTASSGRQQARRRAVDVRVGLGVSCTRRYCNSSRTSYAGPPESARASASRALARRRRFVLVRERAVVESGFSLRLSWPASLRALRLEQPHAGKGATLSSGLGRLESSAVRPSRTLRAQSLLFASHPHEPLTTRLRRLCSHVASTAGAGSNGTSCPSPHSSLPPPRRDRQLTCPLSPLAPHRSQWQRCVSSPRHELC